MGEVIYVCIFLLFGGLLGYGIAEGTYQKQAIDHHCALHDATSGEWRWK